MKVKLRKTKANKISRNIMMCLHNTNGDSM